MCVGASARGTIPSLAFRRRRPKNAASGVVRVVLSSGAEGSQTHLMTVDDDERVHACNQTALSCRNSQQSEQLDLLSRVAGNNRGDVITGWASGLSVGDEGAGALFFSCV